MLARAVCKVRWSSCRSILGSPVWTYPHVSIRWVAAPDRDAGFGRFRGGEIAAGRPVVVVDDEDRENEGDLIFAAELATPEVVAFTVRFTSGYICVPLTEAEADRLDLPPMSRVNQDPRAPPTR